MLSRLLPFALLATPLAAEEFVPAMPTEARLFLRVPEGQPPLKNVGISRGECLPGNHEDSPEKRERLTDIRFPVTWWRWKEVTLKFTPSHDGTLELDLNGPWGEARPGVLRQQEILWDELDCDGAKLSNSGFEDTTDGKPAGWDSPWRPYPAAVAWPLSGSEPFGGKRCAASWHGRPLIGTLTVKAGVPVTLKLHARAATVPGFKKPSILPQDTPAHRACARLKRGVNLGNHWEAPPGGWGITSTTDDIDLNSPIHIGEFGCYQKADPASRARYVRDFRQAAEKRGLPWVMWDWKAGFGYWDEASQKPLLRDALFGK
jgi:endoglucanase